MIAYQGKSYVSSKMLKGECQGVKWTGAMQSEVNPATRLKGDCLSVAMGDKLMYGANVPALGELLAQYPALGELLIQYPALGEFVVEDNDLVHSLVDTGYERWLVNTDTSAYFKTGILPNKNITFGVTLISQDTNKDSAIFGARDENTSKTFILQTYNNTWRTQMFGGWKSYGVAKAGIKYNVEMNFSGIVVDGVQVASGNYDKTDFSCDIWCYRDNTKNSPSNKPTIRRVIEFYCKNNDDLITNRYVPFLRNNGNVDVLDVINCRIAERVGEFTIELTPKA